MVLTLSSVPQRVTDTSVADDAAALLAGYEAFRAIIDDYQEADRPSAGYVLAVRNSVRDLLAVPLSQLEYSADGYSGLVEGRTFRLGISAGIISCRSTDLSKRETTLSQGRYGSHGLVPGDGISEARNEATLSRRSLDIDMGVRIDPETGELEEDDEDGPARSEIVEWSRKSRANMTKTLASLDYSVWPRSDGALAMVTLTLPGDWLAVAPDGRTFKQALERFRRRWVRAVGPWRLLWKLEFQRRGAPHWHALARVPALVGNKTFEQWLAAAWADVVGASKVVDRADGSSEYSRHLSAGTGVDFSGKEFSDPRRISMYFAGHSAKSQDGKEYQHIVPVAWQAPGKGPGRFWGFCGLEKALVELDLTQRDYDRLRRELRKLARARAWEIAVKRSRGAVPVPRVRAPQLRRSMLGGGGGQNGGWVLLNDALSVVRDMSAWLVTPNNGSWDSLIEPSQADTKKRFNASDALNRFTWDLQFSRLTSGS